MLASTVATTLEEVVQAIQPLQTVPLQLTNLQINALLHNFLFGFGCSLVCGALIAFLSSIGIWLLPSRLWGVSCSPLINGDLVAPLSFWGISLLRSHWWGFGCPILFPLIDLYVRQILHCGRSQSTRCRRPSSLETLLLP